MLAISSSPLFSTNNFGWLLDDPITHELLNTSTGTSGSAVALNSSSSQTRLQHCESKKFDQIDGDHHQPHEMVKKLNHNASERDRRKRINSLYSSLRSLIPASDHTKKLSIPSTVSKVLKYIPELQDEVERLIKKKEELTSRTISKTEHLADFNKQTNGGIESSSLIVSASQAGDNEVVIHLSTRKINKGSFAEAVSELEDEGLVLLNASCLETFEERVFYTLHFQVQGTMAVEVDMLRDKLSSYFEKEEKLLLQQ